MRVESNAALAKRIRAVAAEIGTTPAPGFTSRVLAVLNDAAIELERLHPLGPTHYLEGDTWKPWPDSGLEGQGGLHARTGRGQLHLHALQCEDGSVWDTVNGWRRPEPGTTPRAPANPVPPPAADAWAHRTKKMRCATCMWWVLKVPALRGTDDVEREALGRCRRDAPIVREGWPAVYASDWCGAHKLDENKR